MYIACIQAVDGHHESLASLKEGPVHDVAWSPTGSHFIVIAGFMPAKTVLFDAKCGFKLDTASQSWHGVA